MKDPLDGAQYWKAEAVIADYMPDSNGLRPGEQSKPSGKMTATLEHESALKHVILPPRSIWEKGEWKLTSWDVDNEEEERDFRTWIVSGDATPGNYEVREYIVPDDVAADATPKHPKDWENDVFKKTKYPATTSSTKKSETTKKASPLPFGIRFRDPNCGHWFREDDLAGHAKVCPGQQEGESDWAIACQCCVSLDETAKCKPGFPRPKPKPPVAAKVGTKEVKPDGDGTPAT